jgi:hypothetical protein
MADEQDSRRELLKKAAYVAPAILTLKVAPAFAQNGSGQRASGQQSLTAQQGSGPQGQQGGASGQQGSPAQQGSGQQGASGEQASTAQEDSGQQGASGQQGLTGQQGAGGEQASTGQQGSGQQRQQGLRLAKKNKGKDKKHKENRWARLASGFPKEKHNEED